MVIVDEHSNNVKHAGSISLKCVACQNCVAERRIHPRSIIRLNLYNKDCILRIDQNFFTSLDFYN